MKEPLTHNTYYQWQAAAANVGRLEDDITSRITYIITKWFEIFGAKLNTWYFDGAEENEVGDLSRYMNDNNIWNIYVDSENFPDNELYIIDRFGKEYCWQSEIPTRWLFSDFEKEIIEGKKLYEEKEEARKLKRKETTIARKQKDAKLFENAKKKLSKEELAAIRRSL